MSLSVFSAVHSLVQGLLFLCAAVLYLCGRAEYLGFLVLCLALSWVNVLYFSRGDSHMGVYSIMIQKAQSPHGSRYTDITADKQILDILCVSFPSPQMILGDILRFLFVYVTFLFGFSAGMSPPCTRI